MHTPQWYLAWGAEGSTAIVGTESLPGSEPPPHPSAASPDS